MDGNGHTIPAFWRHILDSPAAKGYDFLQMLLEILAIDIQADNSI